MSHSGAAHKVISVILRFTQFAAAIIVLGILSHFCYLISIREVHADGRLIYTMVTAGISVVYTILFCLPFDALFLGFPFDFILWIMWLVAFCLLETKTTSGSCSARWYVDYWGYYWGRYWRVGPVGDVDIARAGCPQWRTVLAFSFITSFLHLISAFLGIYVYQTYVHVEDTVQTIRHGTEKLTKSQNKKDRYHQTHDVEDGTGHSQTGVVEPKN